METITKCRSMKLLSNNWRHLGARVAFVPTMGNLHDGHLALIKAAKTEATKTVVSIFVNPLQFGPNEDFDRYPRTFTADQQKLMECGIDALFTPEVTEIYPQESHLHTFVEVPILSQDLCGKTRSGFFRGIATVVNKLFNIVQPHMAYFGEKDYQQLLVIQKMVQDLAMPLTIKSIPTQRDVNGLALSSRNQYLNPAEKQTASQLYSVLKTLAAKCASNNMTEFNEILSQGQAELEKLGFKIDYLEIRRRSDLQQVQKMDNELIILVAAYLGNARLIDNIFVDRQ